MKRDSKLSGVLHILLHMAEAELPMTSDALAKMMKTNPVVIRRMLAGLREQGLVCSEKGHGGGWTLGRELASISLYDIYSALDEPTLLAMGNRTESPGCLVEQAVNSALNNTFGEAEALLLNCFRQVSLAQLSADFHQRLQASGFSGQHTRGFLGEDDFPCKKGDKR
ncbi:Rrf2 family transcriptional regulator [Cellvibrio japonicus]|uniref:Transcriptional regulator family n=1 Tax=Cellvibrio japonicus (strain Ueda107) TaxID=498211 RepID=B3PHZ5_CELJU|nr:Rrf2 family transcriptional regulator [Cellvibrio japonicus]ACE84217.1 Transcriptional regulator family [Cellvibrio japonicus Ueda107]QEI13930.1 Rrf2 family transcriptional regulator [Cellvibrio japonicus]QEI17504.1 Rrf2 family transcriptional regulator [Cellvibrio japonicus]QEI21080.1 Rrf2 family transcriptional regulator [Cellvibrio japonicus]